MGVILIPITLILAAILPGNNLLPLADLAFLGFWVATPMAMFKNNIIRGVIYGTVAKDSKTLFTLMKTLNIFLLAPVIFYIFPDWPQWIAKIFPTYWLINPNFEIAVKNANLTDVGFELSIAIGICVLLVIPVVALKQRMQV